MKSNLITLLISSTLLMIALWTRQTCFAGAAAHQRYYLSAIMMISGILTVVTLIRLIRSHRYRPISSFNANRKTLVRPRQHYRVQFDTPRRPIFFQKTDGPVPATEFTCPVLDISETGISLGCTGVYKRGQMVQGEIIFDSGRTAPVNGIVRREAADRTCLRLHCTIAPPLLMAVQREQIVMRKAKGPRPAVSKTVLHTQASPLPSHSPKGICRLKKP